MTVIFLSLFPAGSFVRTYSISTLVSESILISDARGPYDPYELVDNSESRKYRIATVFTRGSAKESNQQSNHFVWATT